jgi:hypothetical protein
LSFRAEREAMPLDAPTDFVVWFFGGHLDRSTRISSWWFPSQRVTRQKVAMP